MCDIYDEYYHIQISNKLTNYGTESFLRSW